MNTHQGGWLEEIEFETAIDFVENLRPNHPRWAGEMLVSEWIFRGIGCHTWDLTPSAWRDSESAPVTPFRKVVMSGEALQRQLGSWRDIDKPKFGLERHLLDKWREQDADVKQERIRRSVTQSILELQLLHDFWVIANEVGHAVDSPDWIRREYQLSQVLPKTFGGASEALFEHVLTATAQHHGIPTRFLDWTTHSLTAACFAAEKPEEGQNVAVWALRRDVVKRSRLREFHVPRYQLPFLHAQAGLFVWDPRAIEGFAFTGEWPSQSEVIKSFHSEHSSPSPPRPWAYKLTLPATEANQVMEILWRERISRAHLMPTFDNVSHALFGTVNWRKSRSFLD